jgi:hypothetical protein
MSGSGRQGPGSPEGGAPLSVDTAARLAKDDPEALLSDRVLDYAAALDEVSLERLRKRLSDGYVSTKDLQAFVRAVKARAKAKRAAGRVYKSPDRSELPQVVITTDERAVNEQAVDALSKLPGLFSRNGSLVRIVEAKRRRPGVPEPYTVTEVRAVSDPYLRELMSRSARWSEAKEDPMGGETVVAAHPPDWSVKAVQSWHEWPVMPPLYHLAESPTLIYGNRVIQDPGYDPAAGVFCVSKIVVDVDVAPTREDAQAAAAKLLRLVAQVPLDGDASRSSFLAGLLTPIARWAFKGQTPLFMFDANKEGSGKGFLVNIISGIALGRPCHSSVQTADEEEERKFITSKVLTAQPIVFIDECDKPFGSGPLQSIITQGTWAPRLLGTNDSPEYDAYIVWLAAGNNVQFKSGDITRRTCMIRIVTDLDNPAERTGFDIDDMPAHVEAHRAELFEAALTMLRAWISTGRKANTLDGWGGRWGSFDDWDQVVRGAIVYCGLADPILTKATATAPSIKEGLADLVGGLEEAIALVSDKGEATLAEVHALLEANDTLRKELRGFGSGVTPPAVNLASLRRGINSMSPHLKGNTPSGAQLAALIGRNKSQPVMVAGVRKWMQHRHANDGNYWRVDVVVSPTASSIDATEAAYQAAERAAMQ